MAKSVSIYTHIFYTNVLRLLREQGMTKQEFATKTGMSLSYLSDLTNGKANPTVNLMSDIADALQVPLPLLLESTDMDMAFLQELNDGKPVQSSVPPGYVRVSGVLPAVRAYIFMKEVEGTRKKLAKLKSK